MNHTLRLGVLALLVISFSQLCAADADAKGPLHGLPKEVQTLLKKDLARPDMKRTIGAIAWFGIPIMLMMIAKNKLQKHHAARTIQLKEQQGMQGGINPLMMMMMQQHGMAGMMPDAQVKGMMGQVEQEKNYNGDTTAEVSDLEKIVTEQNEQRVFERHIMNKSKRRLWEAISWISTFIAMFGGVNFLQTAWAWVRAPQGGDIPAPVQGAINDYRAVIKAESTMKGVLQNALEKAGFSSLHSIVREYEKRMKLDDTLIPNGAITAPQNTAEAGIQEIKGRARTCLKQKVANTQKYEKIGFFPRAGEAIGLYLLKRIAMSLHTAG